MSGNGEIDVRELLETARELLETASDLLQRGVRIAEERNELLVVLRALVDGITWSPSCCFTRAEIDAARAAIAKAEAP